MDKAGRNLINNNLRIAANFEFNLFHCGRTSDIGCGLEVGYCQDFEIDSKGELLFRKKKLKLHSYFSKLNFCVCFFRVLQLLLRVVVNVIMFTIMKVLFAAVSAVLLSDIAPRLMTMKRQ